MAGQQIGEVSRRGGWRGSPNTLAALALYGVPTRFPYQRKARRVGKRVEGAGYGRAERRYLYRLEYCGLLPLELLALPCWRRLTDFPTPQRSPMRLALLQAWDKRHTAPLHWSQTQARALAMVADPGNGTPRRTTWFLANT
jgi:hypothetical protein